MQVKAIKPAFESRVYGQGEPPKGVTINGQLYEFNKIHNISEDLYQANQESFKIIEEEPDNE